MKPTIPLATLEASDKAAAWNALKVSPVAGAFILPTMPR